jgi:hypothetical protein
MGQGSRYQYRKENSGLVNIFSPVHDFFSVTMIRGIRESCAWHCLKKINVQ